MYIPHVSREPLFLNRAPSRDPSREDISFICVPIRLMDQAVGALSVDRLLADAPPWRTGAPAFDHCLASGDTALETQGRMSEDARPCLWPEGFVGNSGIMQKVYAGLARWSFRGNGFFAGESGTGKEPAARAIQAPGTPTSHRPSVLSPVTSRAAFSRQAALGFFKFYPRTAAVLRRWAAVAFTFGVFIAMLINSFHCSAVRR